MARTASLPLLLFSLLYISFSAAAPADTSPAAANFIKTSCSTTTYPALCVQSLSAYASSIQQSDRQLAETALTVSVARAQAAKDFVTRCKKLPGLEHRELEAVKDCFDEMSDSVDRLSRAVKELKGMGSSKGQDFIWHVSNVETWVSAALTDDTTCMDGFSDKALDGQLKVSIRTRVLNVAQVTSNALALVTQYASKQ